MRVRTTTIVTTWIAAAGSGCVGVVVGSDSTKPDSSWTFIGSTTQWIQRDTADSGVSADSTLTETADSRDPGTGDSGTDSGS